MFLYARTRRAGVNVQDVRTGFAYNRWANQQLLKAAGELSGEELDRDLGGSFASTRGTLRHLLWGERRWLRFWREGSFDPDLSPADLPDLPSIVASWISLEEEKAAFARELTDERLRAPCRVEEDSYVLGELIQNILVHSIHHRGQVVSKLRQLGKTPPETGFRHFLTENRGEGGVLGVPSL
jgi:uncharacterized damage-inducible protein DinB